MLKRKASEYFNQWKQKKRKKALLVTGARRTGKTCCIRQFGQEQYERFVEINFREDKSAAAVFEKVTDVDGFIERLAVHTGQEIEPGKTLLFLDEVQECSSVKAVVQLLIRDGRYDCIESGRYSQPAYYEEVYKMYPLDFEEFLYANGIRNATIDYVRDCYERGWEVSGSVHEMMKRLFNTYAAVGGMPEAVLSFIEQHDMDKVMEVQKGILELFLQDIDGASGDITKNDKMKMKKILEFLPAELGKGLKRFLLADMKKSARMERYEDSLNYLADAGMTLPCYYVSEPKHPLKNMEKRNLFKLYLVDTGLLRAMYHMQGKEERIDILLENAAAQVLAAKGFSLWYFNEKNKGELGFLIQKGRDIIPIEVKGEGVHKEHAALTFVLERKGWNLREGLVFCDRNIEKEGAVRYLPWYMLLFLNR